MLLSREWRIIWFPPACKGGTPLINVPLEGWIRLLLEKRHYESNQPQREWMGGQSSKLRNSCL